MTVDSDMLHAYLDGELDGEAARRVEAAIATNALLKGEFEVQRRLRDHLNAHFAPVLDEPVPAPIRAFLEKEVVDLAAARQRLRPRGWLLPAAMAASLVVGVAVGQLLPARGEFGTADGALVARGPLAEALDRQLASAQPNDAAIRIGVSFARSDGTLCRTFAGETLSGLACREASDWRMIAIATAAAAAAPRGDFRQARSEAPIVLQIAQDMMVGEPLDVAGERRARDAGWRGR